MLKNLKLLKGITIALAFVLVLGGGILLKMTADAATNTVVLYVSDEGDNSTGADEASAFTSIASAASAANKMGLAPGTELRIIVSDRVSISTQLLDGSVIKDSKGGRIHVTITSLNDGSDEDMSTIYLTYRIAGANPLPTDGSQRAYVVNDITFKNIRILAQVHDVYLNNTNTGLETDLYRIRYFYLNGNKVVFDNCHLTSELGDFVGGAASWTVIGDSQSSSTATADCSLKLINRDYSHLKVWLSYGGECPNYNLSFYAENTGLAEFYAIRRTSTATTDDAKSIKVHFKGCTLGSLYLSSSGGDIGVPGGIDITVEDTEVMKMAGSSGAASVRGDVTYNFIGSTVHGHTDLGNLAFFAPKGNLYGDITVNIEDTDFGVTSGEIYAIGNGGTIHGDVHHNISGDSVFNRYVGGDNAKGTIEGTIYTNISDCTVKENFFGGNYAGGSVKAINNTITGGEFKANIYLGSRYGVVSNNITNTISGGTFTASWLYCGNNVATFGKPTEKIDYRIKNSISNIAIIRFCGGSASTPIVVDEESHGEFANGTIENYFGDNLSFQTACYPGANNQAVHTVKNTFAGTITGWVVGGSNQEDTAKVDVKDKEGNVIGQEKKYPVDVAYIYNTIEEGAVISAFNGGNNSTGRIGSITNIMNGGTITNYTGGGRNSSSGDIGTITNYFNGGTVTTLAYGGSAGGSVESIENYFSGTAFSKDVFGGSKAGTVANCITNTINGGTTYGSSWFIAGNNAAAFGTPTEGANITYRIKNTLSNATFVRYLGSSSGSDVSGEGALGTVENHFGDNLRFSTACYGGSNEKNVTTIKNTFSGKITTSILCGGCNSGNVGYVYNTIQPGADLVEFAGGNNTKNTSENVYNVVTGGTIAKYYGGGRNAGNAGNVYNTILGGTFTGNVFMGTFSGAVSNIETVISGGTFKGAKISSGCDKYTGDFTSTLDIKPDESEEALLFALTDTYGIANPETATITIHGAAKPIRLGSQAAIHADAITGQVTFLQTEEWTDGKVYVTVPADANGDLIRFISLDVVSGSAGVMEKSVGVASGLTLSRLVLIGDSSVSAPAVIPAAPAVDAINFILENNLIVNFYTAKENAENYINALGSFSYSVTFGGKTLASGVITDMADVTIVGDYVKIATDFGIPATKYAEKITVTLEDNVLEYSVYELLELGIAGSANNTALADLLKAIYNYGVEAEKLVGEASTSTYYDEITYTGSYSKTVSAEALADGYAFTKVGLSLGEEVSLDFYLNAASTDGLIFAAQNADGTALAADRISVIPFSGNSKYNVVVSLRLDIASMDDVFTLSVSSSNGTKLATCTNSIASSCATYIEQDAGYAEISGALLAYVEKAQLV